VHPDVPEQCQEAEDQVQHPSDVQPFPDGLRPSGVHPVPAWYASDASDGVRQDALEADCPSDHPALHQVHCSVHPDADAGRLADLEPAVPYVDHPHSALPVAEGAEAAAPARYTQGAVLSAA